MSTMSFQERQEMQAIRDTANQALSELASHTKVCSERQGELRKLVWLIIKILIGATGAIVVGLTATVANLIIHFPPAH